MMFDHACHSGRATPLRAAAALTLLAIIVAFGGALGHDFVNWDDDYLLLNNTAYRGLGLEQIRWMFTTTLGGHYQPLTWLSYGFDYVMWGGVSAAGMHLTNLVLHACAAVVFLLVADMVIAAAMPQASRFAVTGGALAATLLFAVHPLRVESVAWVTERRDVLSGVWLLLCVWFYLRYATDSRMLELGADETRPRGKGADGACGEYEEHERGLQGAALPVYRGRTGRLVVAVLCFVLSLLSKAAGITLPFVLLILDWYPLRRLGSASSARKVGDRPVWEKLLFVVPAVVVALVALAAQRESGALRSLEEHPIALRVAQAFYGVAFYVGKMLWPTNLIPLYEQRPDATAWEPVYIVSGMSVVLITLACWWMRRRVSAVWAAWLVYLILLAPVLGFAQSGPQLVADRYTYFAGMPLALLAGGAIARLADWQKGRQRLRSAASLFVCAAVIALFIALSIRQTRVWSDSLTLWRTTVARAPRTGTAHANLAATLNARGDHATACHHARAALEILPGNRVAHIALARCSAALGDFETAETHFESALHIRPEDPATVLGLLDALSRAGKLDRAEQVARALVERDPQSAFWHCALGSVLGQQARFVEARDVLEQALRLDPRYTDARVRLSRVLVALGEREAAVEVLQEGLQRSPEDTVLINELQAIAQTSSASPETQSDP